MGNNQSHVPEEPVSRGSSPDEERYTGLTRPDLAAIGAVAALSAFQDVCVQGLLSALSDPSAQTSDSAPLGAKIKTLRELGAEALRNDPERAAAFSEIVDTLAAQNDRRRVIIHGLWSPGSLGDLMSGQLARARAVLSGKKASDGPRRITIEEVRQLIEPMHKSALALMEFALAAGWLELG